MQKLTISTFGSNSCNINSAILIQQNGKVQYSSSVTLNSAILKY